MTADQIETLVKEILSGLEVGADLASVLSPAIVPFVLIGKAVDKIIPGLAGTVTRWVEGNPPTQQEIDDFKAKLLVLSNPDLP